MSQVLEAIPETPTTRHRHRHRGRRRPERWEMITAAIVIPVAGVVATLVFLNAVGGVPGLSL